MEKRLALWGARADNSGLGIQTHEFWRHMKPESTLVIDISEFNNKPVDYDKYPGATYHKGFPSNLFVDIWLEQEKPDTVFCCEIPYNYYLFEACRRRGIKTVLQYNYEFLDYLNMPHLPLPDVLAAPSRWHLADIANEFGMRCNVMYLPVPVNREKLPFRQIEVPKKFVHVVGTRAFEDRNGSEIVMQALPLVENKGIHFIIYCQNDYNLVPNLPNCEMRVKDVENYWEIYQDGDVLILPRRYGGLCLQLNEAMSTGMVPIMPEISPQDTFLHPRSLLFPSGSKKIRTRTEFDCYDVDPLHLAQRIDLFASQDIYDLSQFSNTYAEGISWDNMTRRYNEVLR